MKFSFIYIETTGHPLVKLSYQMPSGLPGWHNFNVRRFGKLLDLQENLSENVLEYLWVTVIIRSCGITDQSYQW